MNHSSSLLLPPDPRPSASSRIHLTFTGAARLAVAVFVAFTTAPLARATFAHSSPEAMRSPANQVFQFVQSGSCTLWKDGSVTNATAYLWIPEQCRRVRGLVVMCSNVPEHMLVGHPAIRAACAANDLGIVWCVQTFFNFKAKSETATDVAFLQQLLDGLAKKSGYDEVAAVPWLPMGESGHLLMVDALVEQAPQRCIAGIWMKNPHQAPKNRDVPDLTLFGNEQEWSQDKQDFIAQWRDTGFYDKAVVPGRKADPNWPLTFVFDGESGHFDCSERVTSFFAKYIDSAAKARLKPDGCTELKPVDLDSGYVADLPLPGHADNPPKRFKDASPEERNAPWFFTKEEAEMAQAFARIEWKADLQLPSYRSADGKPFPHRFNGITWIDLNKPVSTGSDGLVTPTLETEPDGVTFTVKTYCPASVPPEFADAGKKLGVAPCEPAMEWLCGAVEPLGNNRFRVTPDRGWPSPLYIAARAAGSRDVRGCVQPLQIGRDINTEGAPQKIAFDQPPDAKAGVDSIVLNAKADSGLPVGFFVVQGPAKIDGNKLIFTPIPPRSKLPLVVTVGAYQMGRHAEPKIRRAEIVRQTFQIVAP